MSARFVSRGGKWGVRFEWDARPWYRPFVPSFESWRWHRSRGVSQWDARWLGIIVWRDTSPPTTVGERGVW